MSFTLKLSDYGFQIFAVLLFTPFDYMASTSQMESTETRFYFCTIAGRFAGFCSLLFETVTYEILFFNGVLFKKRFVEYRMMAAGIFDQIKIRNLLIQIPFDESDTNKMFLYWNFWSLFDKFSRIL